jgi:F-type H+-transporting ATPase subunit c
MLDALSVTHAAMYLGAGLSIGFGAIGAAVGEGYTAGAANEALSYRPEKAGEVVKNMLVGQAVAESAAIFALVIAIILLFTMTPSENFLVTWKYIGAGLAMGLAAIGTGIGSGFPAAELCRGIARQPAYGTKLLTTMLVSSAICQTTAIYGMIIALLLLFVDNSGLALYPGWGAILGAGLAAGFGAIGPGIGEGICAGAAVKSVSRNPEATDVLTRTMLVGMAVTESTGVYALVVALLLIAI